MRKINSVTVLVSIAFFALIATAGFCEGGNMVAATVSFVVFAVSLIWANEEDGKKKR